MAGDDPKIEVIGDDADERTPMYGHEPVLSAGRENEYAYLIVIAGTNLGEMFKVNKALVIGRSPQADVRLYDDGVSREHARLTQNEGEEVVLEDLGSTNGTFVNGRRVTRQVLTDGDKILIGSTSILKFTYHDHLDEQFQRQMYESALRDALTRAFNRKYFNDRMESEFHFARRHGSPLTLILFDIDHFKLVNDQHGHLAGDFVLSGLATLIMGSIRAEDILARYGGEEFAIICRGTDLLAAQALADRLRRTVEQRSFPFEGKLIPITISAGVATVPDPKIQTAAMLIGAADAAMYEAKAAGRNTVRAHKHGT